MENLLETSKKSHKVLVIGLDGATFDLLLPWIDEGLLPHTARLVKEGISGRLASTLPPVTGPAWVSFMTGKSPGKHGIFDFGKPFRTNIGRRFVTYRDIEVETLWSILSRNDCKIGVLNVPITYPPPKVNGFIISGMLTPNTNVRFTTPASLAQELEAELGKYILDVRWRQYENKRDEFLKRVHLATEMRGKATLYLMQKYPWDFFMTVIMETDRIQHVFWHELVPEKHLPRTAVGEGNNPPAVSVDARGKNGLNPIVRYYQRLDEILGSILASAGEDATVLVISDHGFGPIGKLFFINKWLNEIGLLVWDEKKLADYFKQQRYRATLRKVPSMWKGLLRLKNLTGQLYHKAKSKEIPIRGYGFLHCIDWTRTRAYSVSNTEQGIYINLRGREPSGIVSPAEYEEIRSQICAALKNIKDPLTGEFIECQVYKREEIHSGPYLESAPDIVFVLKNGEYYANVQFSETLFGPPNQWTTGSGTHRMDGIFIAAGKGIRKGGGTIEGARIIDITPTILHLMGIPIPDDMDGVPLIAICENE